MKAILAAVLVALAAPLAMAQEQAFANRTTELKESARADGRTLGQVRDGTEVKVLQRLSGWARIESSAGAGWVRVFHLRFPATVEATAPSGGGFLSSAGNLFGGRARSQQANIATVGIRGLTPEELKNASPDPQALRQMQSYRADKPAAERFARDGKLAATTVDSEGGR